MTPATILEYDGISQPITEWALDYGITPAIIIGRLERGEAIANAITTPMQLGHRGQRLNSPSIEAFIRSNAAEWKQERRELTSPRSVTPQKNRSVDPTHASGVVSNLRALVGTGAGSTAQETPNITFSQEAAE